MDDVPEVIDLRDLGELSAHGAAFHHLTELRPGTTLDLVLDEEPSVLLQSLNQQLRHHVHWEIVEAGPPAWRVRVCHREDVPPGTPTDLLMRDHERLNRLFVLALQHVNAGRVAEAEPVLQEFSLGLRRHVHAENDILAPAFVAPRDTEGADPTSTMLREHEQIVELLQSISFCFVDGRALGGDLEPQLALLSGILVKHEACEEETLFPQWETAIAKAPEGRRDDLLRIITAVLQGQDDYLL
jgi:uncharacterized protein (DUF2249 family)